MILEITITAVGLSASVITIWQWARRRRAGQQKTIKRKSQLELNLGFMKYISSENKTTKE